MAKYKLNETFENILFDVLKLKQEDLHEYCLDFLSSFYETEEIFEHYGEGIYFKGDAPVLLVAHMDTVHFNQPTDASIFWDREKNVLWSPDGIGADCRAGIFNVLSTVAKGYKPHVMLTWEEERGGIGASALMRRWDPKNTDAESILINEHMSTVNFAIQYDRHGFDEAVYYELDSKPFEEYISSFGYVTNMGSYTDICEICPTFGFAGVNVAAGYVSEHTKQELLFVDEMMKTHERVISIIEDQMENPTKYEYVELESNWYSRYYGSGLSNSSKHSWWDEEDEFYSNAQSATSSGGLYTYPESNDLVFDNLKDCYSCEVVLSDDNHSPSEISIQNGLCFDCRVKFCEEDADIPTELKKA